MNPRVTVPVRLKDREPLAIGGMRLVFRHPADPALLIKVIRPEVIEKRWGAGAAWYKRHRRFKHYISFAREADDYLATYASHGKALPFVQKVVGFMETDYGLGLVVEAALDRDGNLAPNLRDLLRRQRVDRVVREKLEEFLADVIESDVIVADLNIGNMVYAYDPVLGDRFVLIDGIGMASVLPFKQLSRTFNRWSKRCRVRNLHQRLARAEIKFPQPR